MLFRSLQLGIVVTAFGCAAARAQTTAFWVDPVSGNWTDAARWSTNPIYPDNDGVATFSAVIDTPIISYTVTVDDDIAVDNFTFDNRVGTLTIPTGGALRVGNATELRGARVSIVGGTLDVGEGTVGVGDATLEVASGIRHTAGILRGESLWLRSRTRWEQTGGENRLHSWDIQSGSYIMSGGLTVFGDQAQVNVGRGGGVGTALFMHTGGTVQHNADYFVTAISNSRGTTIVDGPQTRWDGEGVFVVGFGTFGNGTTSIRNRATVNVGNMHVGLQLGAGTLTVESGAHVTARRLESASASTTQTSWHTLAPARSS